MGADFIGIKYPTMHAFVKNLVESAKRCVQTPGNKKYPITAEILICDIYNNSQDLAMILLVFSGFFRLNEFISLRCSGVSVQSDHLVKTIRKSKTDQYRHGNRLVISKGITSACPQAMFVRYSQLAQLDPCSDDFLSKQVFRSGDTCKLIYYIEDSEAKRKEVSQNLGL
jgi:hypothetical protein